MISHIIMSQICILLKYCNALRLPASSFISTSYSFCPQFKTYWGSFFKNFIQLCLVFFTDIELVRKWSVFPLLSLLHNGLHLFLDVWGYVLESYASHFLSVAWRYRALDDIFKSLVLVCDSGPKDIQVMIIQHMDRQHLFTLLKAKSGSISTTFALKTLPEACLKVVSHHLLAPH